METKIVYGESLLETNVTHRIQSIDVDNHSKVVTVSIRKGIEVDIVKFTMEFAQEIGFINVNALNKFVK